MTTIYGFHVYGDKYFIAHIGKQCSLRLQFEDNSVHRVIQEVFETEEFNAAHPARVVPRDDDRQFSHLKTENLMLNASQQSRPGHMGVPSLSNRT